MNTSCSLRICDHPPKSHSIRRWSKTKIHKLLKSSLSRRSGLIREEALRGRCMCQHNVGDTDVLDETIQNSASTPSALISTDADLLSEIEKEEEVELRGEAVAAWIGAAVAFGVGIWYFLGREKAEEYFAGYLLEQSLSVDNLFVFILVFNFFKTPEAGQIQILNYGIITAGVLRLIMIVLGVELIDNFKPVLLFFAGLLIYSSYNLLSSGDTGEEDLNDNAIVKLCNRFLSVSTDYDGLNFFTVQKGIKMATPLLLTLAVVELSDVVFAVDSIPAVFGVTLDPFIVYTSNIFAILSLRSLYGFVSVIMQELEYLDKAVAVVLGFIGAKMVADFGGYHISTEVSLLVVGLCLLGGVGASYLLPKPDTAP